MLNILTRTTTKFKWLKIFIKLLLNALLQRHILKLRIPKQKAQNGPQSLCNWLSGTLGSESLPFCAVILRMRLEREEPRWRRTRTGRPLSLLQIHQRITECRANFTKQLLIASWGRQAPRKATQCLRKEVGQNIKDKKRDKRAKDGDPPGKGVLIEEVSKHQETLALAGLGEVFESRRATWLGGEQ